MAGLFSFALARDPDQSTNVQQGYTNVLGTPVTPAKLTFDWVEFSLRLVGCVECENEISSDERPGSEQRIADMN